MNPLQRQRCTRIVHKALVVGAQSTSVEISFVLVSCGQQQDVGGTNCKQNDTPALAERNDQLTEFAVCFRSATGVWREREDADASLHCITETQEVCVVGRVARQLALHDVFLPALEVFLKRSGRNCSERFGHLLDRLFLAATASRIRCCAA